MIQATLHGKVPEFENVEDLLTSSVFGRLRYLPPGDALIPFLETAFLYDCSPRTTLKKYFAEHNILFGLYKSVKYFFWCKHSNLGEPDLILIFSNHQNGDQDLLILVEAKYKSPKSSTGENDQLKRYYIAITEQPNEFYHVDFANFSGIIGPIIYLTEMEASSEIQDAEQEIVKAKKTLKHPIFHLRWQQLYKILEQRLPQEQTKLFIFEDLLSHLKDSNLEEFSGITCPSKDLDFINNHFPVFYNEVPQTVQDYKYFKNLPLVSFKEEKYCFYRG